MPASFVTVTGQVSDSSGVLTTVNGYIHFSLSQAGSSIAGGQAIAAGADTAFVLTNGVIAASSQVIGNDDVTPSGTYYASKIVSSDGAIIAVRNYTILFSNGASQTIGSLAAPSTPFSSGTGIPSSRLFTTTAPLTGGGDLSADRTLGATVSPGGAGTLVGTTRQILTTAPVAGGGDLSADRTISVPNVTSGAAGLAPASGGGTVNFLRADAAWAQPTLTGGVNAQTISYLAVAGDDGKIISMNGVTLTLTLPAAPPSATWGIFVENLAATSLTVSRNGLNIDGAASNLTVTTNGGVYISTDGTNYFASRGTAGVPTTRLINTTAPITGGGDLSADRTLVLTTSPAGQTPVGVTRTITATLPVRIAAGASADLSADRTISLTGNANFQSQPGNPAGTFSATLVMMGIAGSITPATTGKIFFIISGAYTNTSTVAAVNITIRFGTGTAPTNGAAVTGTAVGANSLAVQSNSVTAVLIPFSCQGVATGLSVGTAYWIDLALSAGAGTSSVQTLSVTATEF